MARLQEYDYQDLKQKMIDYTAKEEIPIVAEFAYLNGIPRQYLYEIEELTDTIKLLVSKKEANLERKAIKGECPPAFAIFSLKQLGWKDKSEVEQTIVDKTKMAKELENTFE